MSGVKLAAQQEEGEDEIFHGDGEECGVNWGVVEDGVSGRLRWPSILSETVSTLIEDSP